MSKNKLLHNLKGHDCGGSIFGNRIGFVMIVSQVLDVHLEYLRIEVIRLYLVVFSGDLEHNTL